MFAKKENASFLVTFKAANLEAAHDPEYMQKLGKQQKKLLASDLPIHQFVRTGHYHTLRGQYVYEQIQDHHKKTAQLLQKLAPKAIVASSIPISNSFLVVGSKEDLKRLEACDQVIEIHNNESFKVDLPTLKLDLKQSEKIPGRLLLLTSKSSSATTNVQWNVAKIGAPQVWDMGGDQCRGERIVYAIADTGVSYEHPNIKNNYIGLRQDGTYNHNYAWYDGVRQAVAVEGSLKCGFASDYPCDDQGHGTHVTSTAVGANGYGVAPNARWMACRNMDRGVGSPETYLNCLNFFLAPHDLRGRNPKPELRPHVVGNSYGCPDSEGCSKHAMHSAVEALRAAGVFMSVSAGNEGPNCGTVSDPPALEPSVVSVGATDSNDQLASFSSRGPCQVGGKTYRKPDVSAPGVRVMAAYPGDTFRSLSGTSMASPHVGGAVALITAMCPCYARNVSAIQDLLQQTAVHLTPPSGQRLCGGDTVNSVPNNFFGYGRINVFAAVKKCQAICSKSAKED